MANMAVSAKDIRVAPIAPKIAHYFVQRYHYSGKTVNNSQLHFGIWLGTVLIGVMQFGPSLDKSKLIGLVSGTRWNEFLELNRMVCVDDTPKNTESRALAIAMRLIRQHYPYVQWIISFADATQCGDGTIYRASGFVLTGIKRNTQVWSLPDQSVFLRLVATDTRRPARQRLLSRISVTKGEHIRDTGAASMRPFIDAGAKLLSGYQLRYIYFLDPSARDRLTVPMIPFSYIKECGASMYKGKRVKDSSEPLANHAREGGAAPTHTLH